MLEELNNELFITKGEHILFQVKGTNEICKQEIQLFSKVNIEKKNRKLETDTCKMEVIKYIVDTNFLAYEFCYSAA